MKLPRMQRVLIECDHVLRFGAALKAIASAGSQKLFPFDELQLLWKCNIVLRILHVDGPMGEPTNKVTERLTPGGLRAGGAAPLSLSCSVLALQWRGRTLDHYFNMGIYVTGDLQLTPVQTRRVAHFSSLAIDFLFALHPSGK
jgi:hypothetical protein